MLIIQILAQSTIYRKINDKYRVFHGKILQCQFCTFILIIITITVHKILKKRTIEIVFLIFDKYEKLNMLEQEMNHIIFQEEEKFLLTLNCYFGKLTVNRLALNIYEHITRIDK